LIEREREGRYCPSDYDLRAIISPIAERMMIAIAILVASIIASAVSIACFIAGLARLAVINKGFGRGGERSGNGENKKKLFHGLFSFGLFPSQVSIYAMYNNMQAPRAKKDKIILSR
jgi:hypothetical protein